MAKIKFYSPYTCNFVFKITSNNFRKLANLTNNEEFVKKFEEGLSSFANYKDDLQKIFNEAIQARDEALEVFSRLCSLLGDLFPKLVLRKLTCNLTIKNLPFQ